MIGIEHVVTAKAPKETQVRCFMHADSALAANLPESFAEKTGNHIKLNFINGYENKIVGSQLEVWLK